MAWNVTHLEIRDFFCDIVLQFSADLKNDTPKTQLFVFIAMKYGMKLGLKFD